MQKSCDDDLGTYSLRSAVASGDVLKLCLKPWRDFCSGLIAASMDRNLRAVKFVPNWIAMSDVMMNE